MIRHRISSDDDIFETSEEVNPMDTVANISDVMLVLAVGMMMALVLAWNVNIADVTSAKVNEMDPATEIQEDEFVVDDSQAADNNSLNELGLSEYGKVYVDEDGKLYVLKSENDGN